MTHLFCTAQRATSRRHLALALAALGLLATASAAGASPAERLKMHRSSAGTPGPDGWLEATSTAGNFSVRLPCRFNDFTLTPGAGDVVQGDALGCGSQGIKFAATRLRYRDAALASKFFEGFAQPGMLPGATLERSPHRDRPAITRQFDNDGECGLMRIVRGSVDNVVMTVEAPAGQCSSASTVGMRFLDSLVIDAAPAIADAGPAVATSPNAMALSECPLDAELAGPQAIAAFKALPRDVEEQLPGDACTPATRASVMMRRDGLCRIGDQTMTFASLMTLKDADTPVSMMFMTAYRPDSHAALQATLEQRYRSQPASNYPRAVPARRQPATLVVQPHGTLVILGKSPPETPGDGMTSVQQFAPANAGLVNRDINTCR